MNDRNANYTPGPSWRYWGVGAVAVLIVGAALWNIKTVLGVEGLTVIGIDSGGNPIYDKVGHDAIWRVWWRARDEFISVSPSWLLTVALLVALLVFVGAILACVWIALTPDPKTEIAQE
jgi:hypothetical protein